MKFPSSNIKKHDLRLGVSSNFAKGAAEGGYEAFSKMNAYRDHYGYIYIWGLHRIIVQVRSPGLSLRRCRDESQASIWPGKGSARAEASRGPTGRDHSCGHRGIYGYICYILKALKSPSRSHLRQTGSSFTPARADVASRAPRSNEGDVRTIAGSPTFSGAGLENNRL